MFEAGEQNIFQTIIFLLPPRIYEHVPLKRDHFKRKVVIFQPAFFKKYVSFGGSTVSMFIVPYRTHNLHNVSNATSQETPTGSKRPRPTGYSSCSPRPF